MARPDCSLSSPTSPRSCSIWLRVTPPDTMPRLESRPAAADDLRETLAALGEWMWGPPDPDAETFRRRFDRDVAAYPTPQPAPPAPPRPDPLADDEAE